MNMLLHYDAGSGPVMKAAKMALETGNVNYILIWVPEESENKLKNLFDKTFCERRSGKDVQDIAINCFFETVKRLHRAGASTLYTYLKPAGIDKSLVILNVERAIETGNSEELIGFISKTMEDDFRHRFYHVMKKKNYHVNNVTAGRKYVTAFNDFIVYVHNLYTSIPEKEGHAEH
jgi:hypothetical protein